MKNQKGFSLIELLIVVVIIGIIAAIAIPNLLASRRSANEGSAISSLRTLHGGQMTYQATAGGGNYADTLTTLGTANVIDSVLASGTKSGYAFTMAQKPSGSGNPASFAAVAKPVTNTGISATGTRNFGIATEGVIASETATTNAMSAVATGTSATFGAGTALNN